jgi:3-isopropylmalate dehydrogenase
MGTKNNISALKVAARAMDAAVDKVLAVPASRTRDLGGSMNCDEFGRRAAQVVGS